MNDNEKTLRETLETVIMSFPADHIALEDIMELIGREGLLMVSILLTLPFMVPVSIPGVSTVFGFTIFLIGVSMLANRLPWLPKQLLKRPLPAAKLKGALQKGTIWVHRIEKFSTPRLLGLTHGLTWHRLNGGMLIVGALLLMVPFSFIPFSNTLPGLAVLLLALGMLQRDGYCIVLGYGTITATIIYFSFLLLGGVVLFEKIVAFIK